MSKSFQLYPESVRFMKKVKNLLEDLVVAATDLGGLQYRLRTIEEVIKGIDARARDMKDREFLRASLALQRRSRNISISDARRLKHQITRARSRIESISAKLERHSLRPR